MVFWKNYPLQNIIISKCNNKIFKSLKFQREEIYSPTGIEAILVNRDDLNEIREIKEFIKYNFGNPPKTPILDIPEDKLILEKDIILYVKDTTQKIVGCIRYHYLGIFLSGNNQDIYCEDCFCIHPSWRKKGVGDYLLNKLHLIVNERNIPYSMFLKEGKQLSIFNFPFYSGSYIYRQIKNSHNINVSSLSVNIAYKLMDILCELQHNIFIIRNKDSPNQIWRLYKNNTYKVLACIQDTYQQFEEEGIQKKIGWITCWIESSNMTDIYREDAAKQISDSVYGMFDYIWANRAWVKNVNEWKDDGPFHWYLYQWTTNISIKKSYCILH